MKTEIASRPAYECAHSSLSFLEYPRLMAMQSMNGVNIGETLVSSNACSNVIKHVTNEMKQEVVRDVVDGKKLFSIMIDESTTIANSQVMIIYLCTEFEDEVCTFFLGLIPVVQPSATDLKRELSNFLHVIGLTDAVLAEQLIGFCSDGASTMVG